MKTKTYRGELVVTMEVVVRAKDEEGIEEIVGDFHEDVLVPMGGLDGCWVETVDINQHYLESMEEIE